MDGVNGQQKKNQKYTLDSAKKSQLQKRFPKKPKFTAVNEQTSKIDFIKKILGLPKWSRPQHAASTVDQQQEWHFDHHGLHHFGGRRGHRPEPGPLGRICEDGRQSVDAVSPKFLTENQNFFKFKKQTKFARIIRKLIRFCQTKLQLFELNKFQKKININKKINFM